MAGSAGSQVCRFLGSQWSRFCEPANLSTLRTFLVPFSILEFPQGHSGGARELGVAQDARRPRELFVFSTKGSEPREHSRSSLATLVLSDFALTGM